LITFIYSGSIIKDSRKFCKEYFNKVYTRNDVETFDKMDWEGKKS